MHRLATVSLVGSIVVAVTLSTVSAQTPKYLWTPKGSASNAGGTSNTIPFWGMSGTYQQILDAGDFNATPVRMKGMAMRPYSNQTLNGRTWELRIALGHTKVKAALASTTFSTNLGPNPTVVYGSATGFAKFSWSTVAGSGSVNPPAFTIPFVSPYTYTKSSGHLCWEWRHKNASIVTQMYVDATQSPSQLGKVLGRAGRGCTPSTQLAPATVTMSTTGTNSGGYFFQSSLTNAASKANAFMALSPNHTTLNLGWCTAVEVVPVGLIAGKTSVLGVWTLQAPLAWLSGVPSFRLWVQYVFDDASQVGGLGLSDVAAYQTPDVPGAHVIKRVYSAMTSTNGAELETTGRVDPGFLGLVVGWLQ